jgi:starch synthase (maltosyl-transferring)
MGLAPRSATDGRRILIEAVSPELDAGRYPIKRLVGDTLEVEADILKDGHDVLGAAVRYRRTADVEWREAPMRHVDNDRWAGAVPLAENTRYVYTLQAWTDGFASWAQDLERRVAAGQDVASELREGSALVGRAASRATGADRRDLEVAAAGLAAGGPIDARVALALGAPLAALMARWGERADLACYDRELEVVVDRPAAGFAAWYELFPRSQGRAPGRSGTFDDVIARLDDIRAMGFDVVYLPPIHPIGRTGRKGRDNALVAGPGDPGSPWAIGSEEGGHTAVEPGLGTLADFRRLVEAARDRGMEIALDFAIQCSPDHPWVREHPEWFHRRPDGTIKYAENPPKKYEDIYPVNFGTPDREGLWQALRAVVEFWIAQEVRTFRVDNPHTKPLPFWRWLIEAVQARYPDVIFLAEAFTRPKLMRALGKLGFTQSYTYFTWRNTKAELTEYLTELTGTPVREYFRGNFFVNTPDILSPYLQHGGRPAFKIRVALAATLSPLYGIYSGFELCENAARPGAEEYADNEKYEVRVRDWDAPGNIKDYIARLNALRRAHPALQPSATLAFHPADDDAVLFYGKVAAGGVDAVFAAVNLDPTQRRETAIQLPLAALGIGPDEPYRMRNLLTGEEDVWQGAHQRIWLDPHAEPAFLFSIPGGPGR